MTAEQVMNPVQESQNADGWPSVSVVVPLRNEERHVTGCLQALLSQNYSGPWEILLVDGMSSDGTRQIVAEYQRDYPNIRLIENVKRSASSALNLGLHTAQSYILVRVDARSICAPDYLSRTVGRLMAGEAESVGGVQQAVGYDRWSRGIAHALNSPLGVGGAIFRYDRQLRYVDTVYLGAWKRSYLVQLGGWNEGWAVNEDLELNLRIKRAGGRILLDPGVRVEYILRNSLAQLWLQYFRFGFWRVKTCLRYPEAMRVSHLGPMGLIGAYAAVVGLSTALVNPIPLVALAASHAGLSLVAGYKLTKNLSTAWVTGLAVMVVHLAWGTGFWLGAMRFGFPLTAIRGSVARGWAMSTQHLASFVGRG